MFRLSLSKLSLFLPVATLGILGPVAAHASTADPDIVLAFSEPCLTFPVEPLLVRGYYCSVGEMTRAYTVEGGYDCVEYRVNCAHPEPNQLAMEGTCYTGPDECNPSPSMLPAWLFETTTATPAPEPFVTAEPSPSGSPAPETFFTSEPSPIGSPAPEALFTSEPSPTGSPAPVAFLTSEPSPAGSPAPVASPTPTGAELVSADGTGRGPRIVHGFCYQFGEASAPAYVDGYYCWIGALYRAYQGGNGYDCQEYEVICAHPEPDAPAMGGTCISGPAECDEEPAIAVDEVSTTLPWNFDHWGY